MANVLGDVELPGIPKRPNCLAWSEDGDLAVAINDQVYVLSPTQEKAKLSHESRTKGSWDRTQFSVGSFLQREWPEIQMDDMISTRDAFIGREQTPAEVVSIVWSSPGAIQRSCCSLAILTTNGLLSLWAMDSHQTAKAKWRRKYVVNNMLNLSGQKILAMVWAPALDSCQMRPDYGSLHISRRPLAQKHYLAVMLEDFSMRIFMVTPFSAARSDKHRLLRTMATITISETSSKKRNIFRLQQTPKVSPYAPALGTILYGIRWSNWHYDPDHGLATAELSVRGRDIESRIHVRSNRNEQLIAERKEQLSEDSEELRSSIFDGEGWSGSCLAVDILGTDSDALEQHRACVVTQDFDLKFFKLKTANYPQVASSDWIPWVCESSFNHQIQRLKLAFSGKYNNAEAIDVRVWGLAMLGEIIALCITLHPHTLLHYVTSAATKTHILFSRCHPASLNVDQSYANTVGLQPPQLMSQRLEKTDFEAHSEGVIYTGLVTGTNELPSIKMNYQVLFTVFVASLLYQDPARSFQNHVETVLRNYRSNGRSNSFIAMISESISQNCNFEEISPSIIIEFVNQFIQETSLIELAEDKCIRYLEYCSLLECGQPVFWNSSLGASCIEGHHQERCSLTALAIMNPYVVKRCEWCDRPYLDETRLDLYYSDAARSGMMTTAQHQATVGDDEDAVEWMLQAVTCIYCNGKFSRLV